jgi:hypothetical protein
MIIALGVMLVTSLLCAAAFVAVESDARIVGHDLQGKQAYAAAQAGVQAYLYQLNENSLNGWWENCSNDSQSATTVPGSSTGVKYSWQPVTTCNSSDPVGSLIDTAGNLRIEFTGYAGPSSAQVTRTIVASFRTDTPLSYLWYTIHETLDPAADSNCANDPFYYNQVSSGHTIPSPECTINWITGDQVNGPLYTEDQLLIGAGASPTFNGPVTSDAPSSDANQVCVGGCDNTNANFNDGEQTVQGGGQAVPFPTDNSNLETDASPPNGLIETGTTNVTLSGTTVTVVNCPGSSSSCATVYSGPVTGPEIMYASSLPGCNTTYKPNDVSYAINSSGDAYGPCGDIYVSGYYAFPLTLAADNDIVIMGSLENINDRNSSTPGLTAPTGTATLGLVADEYVRVYHPEPISNGVCSASNNSNPNVTIDAAILTLQHSFFVDNYSCGSTPPGTLTVHGAIAQEYRGAVGSTSGNSTYGYLKNYNYDNRLATLLPPYMFDLQSTQWGAVRETLCTMGSNTANTCANT